MHAYLITQSTSEDRRQFANKLISEKRIDASLLFKLTKSEDKKSIGIEDTIGLKRWMGQLSTKPRGALIEEAQLLTVPAQQSLLKTIEEPGSSMLIILTADAEMSLLPTIRSRCKVLRLKSKIEKSNLFSGFPVERRVGERILWLYGKLSEYAGKKISPHQGSIGKETGMRFVEKIIEEIDSNATGRYNEYGIANKTIGRILREAAKAHQRLKQNISPTLVLQEFVLNV